MKQNLSMFGESLILLLNNEYYRKCGVCHVAFWWLDDRPINFWTGVATTIRFWIEVVAERQQNGKYLKVFIYFFIFWLQIRVSVNWLGKWKSELIVSQPWKNSREDLCCRSSTSCYLTHESPKVSVSWIRGAPL